MSKHTCDMQFFCRSCGEMFCEHEPECGCTPWEDEDEYEEYQ